MTISKISTFVPNTVYKFTVMAHHSEHIDLEYNGTFSVDEKTRLYDIEMQLLNDCLKECDRMPYKIIIE